MNDLDEAQENCILFIFMFLIKKYKTKSSYKFQVNYIASTHPILCPKKKDEN